MGEAEPTFPPLFTGEAAPKGLAPFDKAISAAVIGCDPGLLIYARRDDALEAALVLAPERPLSQAISIVFAPAVGLVDSLGALGPPETAVHHVWPGRFRVNGAFCGSLRAAASTTDPDVEPDWLVIGIDVPLLPLGEGGENPTNTCLYLEGFADQTVTELLESWSRHTLTWIHRWLSDGIEPLHAAWRERAWGVGEPLDDGTGTFMGLDEAGGMLVKTPSGTTLRPLTDILVRA